jgi:nicotinamidase/pyrazinamidase
MEAEMVPALGPGDALIVTDIQNDFFPGGQLEIPGADEILPALNRWVKAFESKGLPVFATRDWHPPRHCSFVQSGGPWPEHCVANTEGAAFAPGLELPDLVCVISKATRPDHEAYSSFDETGLSDRLRKMGVRRLFVGGVATDYCISCTADDAVKLGFEVFLLEDAVRAVDVRPGDGLKAEESMKKKGVRSVRLEGDGS